MPLPFLHPRTIIVLLGLFQLSVFCLAQKPVKIGVCHFQSLIPSHEEYLDFKEKQRTRFHDWRQSEKEILSKIKSLRQKTSRLKEQKADSTADQALEAQIFELNQQGIILERKINDQTKRYFQDQKEFIIETRKAVQTALQKLIGQFARDHQFTLILDSSGRSKSGFPLVLHHSELLDLTPTLLEKAALAPPKSFEAPAIAVVNAQKLFEAHPETEEFQQILSQASQKFQDLDQEATDRLTREFAEIREEILKAQPTGADPSRGLTFSPEQRDALKDLEKKRDQLDEWRARRKQALIEIQQFEFENIKRRILEDLQAFATERSFDLILDQSAIRTSGTLILPGSLDSNNVTREVQDYLRGQESDQKNKSSDETE